jgi:hypothetical protein
LGCLSKPLHYSNQRSGCSYRQLCLNSQWQWRLS